MNKEGLAAINFIGINSPPTSEVKTELPGNDPTPLYFAMALFAQNRAEQMGTKHSPHDRSLGDYIFNPKIWNEDARRKLMERLDRENPHVVLITNTSPSHSYAIRIADTVREHSPNALVFMGGAHEDETMKRSAFGSLLMPGSTLRDIKEGRINSSVDFVFSGDGDYVVATFMQLVADVIARNPNALRQEIKEAILKCMKETPELFSSLPGSGVLAALAEDNAVVSVSLSGSRIDLGKLPFIYRYFPNLSRFDVFKKSDDAFKKTAHLMTSRGCPNTCLFCSESRKVVVRPARIQGESNRRIGRMVGQVCEAAWHGSEAAFFEDSIFLFGSKNDILAFSRLLTKVKQSAQALLRPGNITDRRQDYLQRLVDFEWGCQFTVENILLWEGGEEEILQSMRRAGCSYVFFGIESLAETVMEKVQKHKKKDSRPTYNLWYQKVRKALATAKEAGLNIGASVLFGLPGETRDTIDDTIDGISRLIDDGLLDMVSPNLATYHPGTDLTLNDQMAGKINYIDVVVSRPPYSFFEEADPGRISKHITEGDIWHIWNSINAEWAEKLNRNQTEVLV